MVDRNKTLTERGDENRLEGQGKNVKGKVKDAWGSLTGDRKLESEGKLDQVKGKVQDKFGKAQQDIDSKTRR
jgi:uncharacterized protein YjbJ (UPF0337 family)